MVSKVLLLTTLDIRAAQMDNLVRMNAAEPA